MRALESVAKRLGNTKAVCRKCYVHPDLVNAYLDGRLVASLRRKPGREFRSRLHDLSSEEAAVLALLHYGLTRNPYVARAA
jgi:DNA topoisomerase I